MLNIGNLATASLAQLKSFASEHGIVPVGDKRLLTTWRDAVQDFFAAAAVLAQETTEGAAQCVREIATYDNARKAAKFTVKAIWSSILVCIALITIAIDLYQNREETKEVLMTVYRRQVMRVRDKWCIWQQMGEAVIQMHVTERIVNYRERIRAMARAAAK